MQAVVKEQEMLSMDTNAITITITTTCAHTLPYVLHLRRPLQCRARHLIASARAIAVVLGDERKTPRMCTTSRQTLS